MSMGRLTICVYVMKVVIFTEYATSGIKELPFG